jgi:hypothetical protein
MTSDSPSVPLAHPLSAAGMVGAMTARTLHNVNQGVATYIRHAEGRRDLEGPLARLVDRLPDRADREEIYDLWARWREVRARAQVADL